MRRVLEFMGVSIPEGRDGSATLREMTDGDIANEHT